MEENKDKQKRTARIGLSLCVSLLLVPAAVVFGVLLFRDRKYNLISMAVAFLSCIPFFFRFERGRRSARETVILSVMTAFSVVGRLIFTPVPGFKPVTAVTVISGIALGPEAGFLVGSLSAVVSNIFFGQGPWTPFQMFVWGIIGWGSGLLFYGKKQAPNRWLLSVVGAVAGVLFSLLMDIWTTLSIDGTFLLNRYLANVASSLPFMAIYAVSNVVFLLLLAPPFLRKLERVKTKYGVFTS